jgi:hypothetical protein
MAFDLKILAGNYRVLGSLGITGALELGISTTIGTSRTFQLLGSEANITLDFIPKGTGVIRVPSGYEANISDGRHLVNRAFVNSNLLGKAISATLGNPTITENNFAIVWDNTNNVFTLAAAASSVSYGSGLENVSTVIKLGGTALDRHTQIIGAFDLRLGTTANKLANLTSEVTTKTEFIAGTSRLTLNGTNPVEIIGGTALSSFIINAGGAFIFTDAQASPRGIRGDADYSANVIGNDYIQKVYADNRIAGKNVSPLIINPSVSENLYSIVWDNANQRYTLALIDTGGASTKKEQSFTANGIQTTFTVNNGTINQLAFVDVGGHVQQLNVNYTQSGQIIDTGTALPSGQVITIHYFETITIGSGGGHTLLNNGVAITQRTDLNIRNGLTVVDSGGASILELGGALTKNTAFSGAFSLTGSGLTAFQFSAVSTSLGTPIGAGFVLGNTVAQSLSLGIAGGAILNLGGDQDGDFYIRSSGKFVRFPTNGITDGWVITAQSNVPVWAPQSGGGGGAVDASETVKGIVEEGTDSELAAGTAVGATGARLYVNPAKLLTYINSYTASAHTWPLQQTFTLAPRLSSTTANQFLRVNGTKDIVSVASASQAQMITGTDDVNPATAFSVEKKGTIKRATLSGPGSGNTLTIDCDSKQTVKIIVNDLINYNFNIAVSNHANLEFILLILAQITGTVVITMNTTPFTSVMQKNETGAGVWNNTSKTVTIVAGTTESIELSMDVISSSKLHLKASDLYHAS